MLRTPDSLSPSGFCAFVLGWGQTERDFKKIRCNLGQKSYSVRSATIGSTRVARRTSPAGPRSRVSRRQRCTSLDRCLIYRTAFHASAASTPLLRECRRERPVLRKKSKISTQLRCNNVKCAQDLPRTDFCGPQPGWVLRVAELTLAQYAHLEGIPKDWREWHPSIRKARALSESLFKSWGEALLFRTLAILRLGRVRSGSLRNSACE